MNSKWIKEESYCNIGNVKLYAIFERRYGRMWREISAMKYLANSLPDTVVAKWHEYLKNMNLEIVQDKPENREYIMNPSSKMGQYRHWPTYIPIPNELALKILTLGELP